MSLRGQLEQLLEHLPPGGSVTLDREALAELLEAEPSSEEERLSDLTVPELAEELDRGESTVRGWLADGLIPEAYRLRGREWRVPPEAVRRFLEREAQEEGSPVPVPLRGGELDDWRREFESTG